MSDKAVGIALLTPQPGPDDPGYIYFIAEHNDGRRYVCNVPIVTEPDYGRIKAANNNMQLWAYRQEGEVLHCHPSVNDLGTGWHNSYNWSIQFRLWTEDLPNNPTDALNRLNPGFLP